MESESHGVRLALLKQRIGNDWDSSSPLSADPGCPLAVAAQTLNLLSMQVRFLHPELDPCWCKWQARKALNLVVEVRILGGEHLGYWCSGNTSDSKSEDTGSIPVYACETRM